MFKLEIVQRDEKWTSPIAGKIFNPQYLSGESLLLRNP